MARSTTHDMHYIRQILVIIGEIDRIKLHHQSPMNDYLTVAYGLVNLVDSMQQISAKCKQENPYIPWNKLALLSRQLIGIMGKVNKPMINKIVFDYLPALEADLTTLTRSADRLTSQTF